MTCSAAVPRKSWMPCMPKVSNDLQGLGVLVTRPAHQAEKLCDGIESAGGHAYRLPTISIEASDRTEQLKAQTLLANLQDNDLLIFISANAVQFSQALLGKKTDWPAIQTAVIGRATAQTFETTFASRPDFMPSGDSNSEALLDLPSMQQMQGRRVIIIRGEAGRTLLGDSLQQRGAEVHYANVYRRSLPMIDIAAQSDSLRENVDVITATSIESLQNLVQLLGANMLKWLHERPLFLLHPRQKDAAQAMGFKNIAAVADETSDAALLSAIINWRQQTKH